MDEKKHRNRVTDKTDRETMQLIYLKIFRTIFTNQ